MTLTYHRWLKQTTKIKREKNHFAPLLLNHSSLYLTSTPFCLHASRDGISGVNASRNTKPAGSLSNAVCCAGFSPFFFCLLYHNMTEMNKMDWRCFDRCLTNPSNLLCLLRILEIASSSLKLHSVLAAHGSHERYPMQGCFQFR